MEILFDLKHSSLYTNIFKSFLKIHFRKIIKRSDIAIAMRKRATVSGNIQHSYTDGKGPHILYYLVLLADRLFACHYISLRV